MTTDWRVVIDTSVAVSAVLLPRSVPRRAVDAALMHCRVLISATTVFELEEVLRRPKFNHYVTEAERLEFLAAVVLEAEAVEVHEAIQECRDSNDNKFLELVINGFATHLITGDDDLLSMHPFRGVTVLTPQAFLDAIHKR